MRKLTQEKKRRLHEGTVIPAHPLALNAQLKLDEQRQRALMRYYIDAGAGGVAVGVHTTQFEIRQPEHNLFETVLRLAAEEIEAHSDQAFLKIAGICGDDEQAVQEAKTAATLGYDLGLVAMSKPADATKKEVLKRIEKVAAILPIFGFYLQPSVGGRVFSYDFWRQFADIDGVEAIKLAPFNRYQTLDVVRAVCHSPRKEKIALYTGNDDNIVADLLTTYRFQTDEGIVQKPIVGGLLGHWAVWTKTAVSLLEEIKIARTEDPSRIPELLTRGIEVTDSNAAFFDPAHGFAGCIPGIHEVLRRQGLLEGTWCLNRGETLSPGQTEDIDRIYAAYPHLHDDDFVKANLAKWLK
ncbi:dihydrodipicolinate synthase family protein [Litoribacterium kuwaitense]|uniref:dihydrodipicolinate synthase family protein n=1 Tax=Litoribacterium kuwaitense TaxID=1398745 RepID=UPI0028B0079A|nr:dihydrodipicolinate synthase family protein [Litoribacterium kuwaitense]